MEKEAEQALKATDWEDRFKSAFTVGAILGAADPILRYELDSIPLKTLATKCSKHAAITSGLFVGFYVPAYISSKVREKDDFINYMVSGAVAGVAYGRHSRVQAVNYAVGFAFLCGAAAWFVPKIRRNHYEYQYQKIKERDMHK